MKDISKKVNLLEDRVMIRELVEKKEENTSAGIIIPATKDDNEEMSRHGIVVAVGPGSQNKDKSINPMTLKVGDRVIFDVSFQDRARIDGEEFYIIWENEVKAIIK